MFIKKFLLLFIIFIAASLPSNAGAETGEKITSFDSQITISKENVATVQETIQYDFGTNFRHGIYRDIPVEYDGENGKYYALNFEHFGTKDEKGKEVIASISGTDSNKRIRLGNPNATITGLHTYVITYKLWPVVILKKQQPFVSIDAVGTGWQVPIQKATAKIALEDGANFSETKCFTGKQGSTDQNCTPVSTNEYTANNLDTGEGMTIDGTVPSGYVSHYLQPSPPKPFSFGKFITTWWPAIALLVVALVVAAFSAIPLLRWLKARQKRKQQTVAPQYEPPANITPAEVGLLADDTTNITEVTATLIDLAVKGYLKITQEKKKGISGAFGGKTYRLAALKSGNDLKLAENKLYKAFFDGRKEIRLDELNKSKMHTAIIAFKRIVKESLESKDFYSRKKGILKKGGLTDAGAKEWALVEGFKLYLKVAEKDRLAFTDAPEKTPERFNKLLPYAIALGVEKKWAKQFEGIDLGQSTDWYSGYNITSFSAVSLTSDLNGGFASSVSTNSNFSSSGDSSGGSSGGGTGGGGGGSW